MIPALELKLDWGLLATFIPNKRSPIYNWLYYKEGYSAELVFKMLDEFGIKPDQTVLDPFAGSGTTLLACKERNIAAIGFDVQPVAVFASSVKTRDYDTNKLKDAAYSLLSLRFERPQKIEPPAIVKKCMSKYALEDIMFFRRIINSIEDEDTRNFLLLTLVNAAMRVSWAWKDGGVLKVRKHPSPPLRKMLSRTISRMIRDIKRSEISQSNVIAEMGDARRLNLPDSSIDAVITSPPYLNQIDYQKVYAIENWIVSGETAPAIRSCIGCVPADELVETEGMPPQAQAYLKDMSSVIAEMYRVCRPNAHVAIIVGNAYFPPPFAPVESDVKLAEIAEQLGFTVEKILVLNQRAALRERTEKVGLLRESLVILKKP